MTGIVSYMTSGHRHCDELFVAAESAVSSANWNDAAEQWQSFRSDLERHLDQEERVLFPAFEAATGMTQGPTAVMRAEHGQMRALVAEMTGALEQRNSDRFLGLAETLMVLMQQHNMKEEQILYPMSERTLADAQSIVSQMEQV